MGHEMDSQIVLLSGLFIRNNWKNTARVQSIFTQSFHQMVRYIIHIIHLWGPFKDNKVDHMLFYTLQTTYMISIVTTMRSISTNEE